MKKSFITISILATAFAVAGCSTNAHTATNTHTEVCDSNKTIWYQLDGAIYRSQFYNTSQALLIEGFKFKDAKEVFTSKEIEYLSQDNKPSMEEIQKAVLKMQGLDLFWDVIIEGDLWDDAAYLSINTQYEYIYFESHKEALEFKVSYDKHVKTFSTLDNLLTAF